MSFSSPSFRQDGEDQAEPAIGEQASTGRWTKAEHEAFLTGLKMYGKEWKKVAARVGTRTVVQTRTHAQKYFQKLAKQDTPGSTTIKSTAKSHVTQQNSSTGSTSSRSKVSEVSALTFLAHNYNNHNLAQHHDLPATPPPPEESAASAPAAHARESYDDEFHFYSDKAPEKQPRKKLKLNIPEHHASSDPSTWPQPSPAACGHRKVDEVAAAKLLANFDPKKEEHLPDYTVTPPPPQNLQYLQIINPENLPGALPPDQNAPSTPFETDIQKLMPLKKVSKATSDGVHMKIDDTKLLPNETYLRSSDDGSSDKITPANKAQNSDIQSAHEDGGQQAKDAVHLPIEKTAIHHSNPTLTLLHHAVVELDYSLVANLVSLIPHNTSPNQPSKPHDYTILHTLGWLSSNGLPPHFNSKGQDLKARSNLLLILGILSHVQWDVNAVDQIGGNTALHFACMAGSLGGEGSEEMIRWLIERGADRDAKNKQRHSPLHLALASGVHGLGVTRTLLEMGATVSSYDKSGMGCVRAACASITPFASETPQIDGPSISEVQKTLDNFFQNAPRVRTLVVCGGHCDLVKRVNPIFITAITPTETGRVPLEDLQHVHDDTYIANLVQRLPQAQMKSHRQLTGSALYAVDRVIMHRVRNAVVFLPKYKAFSETDFQTAESRDNDFFESPWNSVMITALHSLSHARCNRCAIVDLNMKNYGSEYNVFDSDVKAYNEGCRLFYYRPSPSTPDENDQAASKNLQHNIIQIPNNIQHDVATYKSCITKRLLPALRAFSPDMILLRITSPVHDVVPWATAQIISVADVCGQGRVVSLMEGVDSSDVGVLDHVKSLIDPYHDGFNVLKK